MTSKSLSFNERLKNEKKYITRNLWTSIIGILLLAAYYILGTIMLISRSINYARIYNQSSEVLQHYKYNAVGRVVGFEEIGFLITAFIAIAFAFQGFSYVFEQKKLDFYLSQPTTRAQRLRKNFCKAFLTYVCMYAVTLILAIIVASLMGGVNKVVLVTALLEFARNLILFFTVYNIAVLAILLSGSFPIAMLVLLFFLVVTIFFGYEIFAYKEMFYATFGYYEKVNIIASPLFDRVSPAFSLKQLTDEFGYYQNFEGFMESLKIVLPGTVDTLLTGIVFFILVLVFSRYRRAEHAGTTIVYRPFRWLVKIVGCVIVGLAAGYVVQRIYSYVWSDKLLALMVVIMLLSTVVCGCVIEAILDSNIKKIFSGMAQTIMALAIVALIFVIFKGDLLGYDSYIPKASSIKSCAITDEDYSYMIDYEYLDISSSHMEITDIASFTELAKIGMKAQKEYVNYTRNKGYKDLGWSDISICYTLKNGRKIYRKITIPYDVDRNLISSIIDSDEYKKGKFAVFYDDEMRDAEKSAARKTAEYSGLSNTLTTTDMPYAELSDAYRKDILEKYSFELANTTLPVGTIDYMIDKKDPEGFSATYAEYRLTVYKNFTNTIEVLKKYGIYSEDTLDVEYIENVCVTNYYPGIDISGMDEDQLNSLSVNSDDSKQVVYTDRDQIEQILECTKWGGAHGQWFDYSEVFDDQYGAEITMNKPIDRYGTNTVYINFLSGKVPEFVVKDTN